MPNETGRRTATATSTGTPCPDPEGQLQIELSNAHTKLDMLNDKVRSLELQRTELQSQYNELKTQFHPATIAVFGTLFGSTATTVGYVLEHRFPWLPAQYLFGIPACIIGCVFLIVAFRRCFDD